MVSVLDKQRVQASFANASESYDGMAVLQRKVGLELISYVPSNKQATKALDLGCGTGFFTQLIAEKRTHANIFALDMAFPMLKKTKQRAFCGKMPLICADAEKLPLKSNCMTLVGSNLALQWCHNLDQLFSGVYRVLQDEGQFVFSTFGAGALKELKAAWAEVDKYSHVNEFCSLDMIEGSLKKSGFSDVKIETVIYHSEYAHVIDLMKELKGIGAHNVSSTRKKTLTSKGAMQQMFRAYPKNEDGAVSASFEIMYVTATARKK